MELYDAMNSLRAIRRLRPDPIEPSTLARIYRAATWAPTGGNVQPWRLVAVTDPMRKQALADLYAPRWRAYSAAYRDRIAHLDDDAKSRAERTLAAGDHLAAHMGQVPVIAVFCFNPSIMAITDSDQARPTVVGGGSVYPAVQNLLLACRNEGVGCVLTTLLCMDEPAVKELLAMPPDWYTCAHVPMGYPVGGGYGPINRRPIEKMVFENSWPPS